jgi:hypothetical protein
LRLRKEPCLKEESPKPGKEGQEGGQARGGQQLWSPQWQCGSRWLIVQSHKMPGNGTWDDFNDARSLFEDLNAKLAALYVNKETTMRDIQGSAFELVTVRGLLWDQGYEEYLWMLQVWVYILLLSGVCWKWLGKS